MPPRNKLLSILADRRSHDTVYNNRVCKEVKRHFVLFTIQESPSSENRRPARHRFHASRRPVRVVVLLVPGRREAGKFACPVRLGIVANDLVPALSSGRARNCSRRRTAVPLGTEAAWQVAPPSLGNLRSHSLIPRFPFLSSLILTDRVVSSDSDPYRLPVHETNSQGWRWEGDCALYPPGRW